MAADPASTPPKRRRWLKWLVVLSAIVIVACVLIVLVPTFVSWGIANGFARSAMQDRINGTVELGRINASWFGQQGVEGLHVKYPNGKTAVRVDVAVHAGLLELVFGADQPIDVFVAGQANGSRRDGKLSFAELVKEDAQKKSAPPPRQPSTEPFRLPEIPAVTLRIREFDVDFVDHDHAQHYVIGDLNGSLAYREPTEPITVDLKSQTVVNDVPGELAINATCDGLFNARRELSLRQGSAKVDVLAKSIPLRATGQEAHVNSLTINLASDDLTERIALIVNADGQLQGREPSTLALNASVTKALTTSGGFSPRGAGANINLQAQNIPILGADVNGVVRQIHATVMSADLTQKVDIGVEGQTQLEQNPPVPPSPLLVNLSVTEPFASDGTMQMARLDRIAGEARAEAIPTAVVEPFLPEPLDGARDIGPTVNVQAKFGAGERRDVSLSAVGAKARLELTANVNPAAATQAITGSHLLLASPAADPVLVKHYASLDVDRPTDVEIRLTSFALPAVDPQTQSRPRQHMAATGSLKVNGPTTVLLASASGDSSVEKRATPLELANLNVQFDTPALARHVKVQGSAVIDGARATFDQTITDLFNDRGELAAADALAAGELRVAGLPPQTLAKFAPPEQQQIINDVIGEGLSATVTSTVHESQMNAQIEAQAAAANVRMQAIKNLQTVAVQSANIEVKLTPQLLASLQKDREKPISIAQPATLTIDVDQIELVKNEAGAFALADQPINGSLSLNDVVLENAPGLAEPLAVKELVAQLTREREGSYESYSVVGDASFERPGAERVLGHARYKLKLNTKQVGDAPREILPHVDVGFNDLSIRQVERLLAMERGTISQWTGDVGQLSLHVEGDLNSKLHGNIRTELPNLDGNFRAETDMKMVSIDADTTSLTLSREAIENRLNPPQEAQRGNAVSASTPGYTVASDVPMQLVLPKLRFPMTLATGEKFDPSQVEVEMRLTGGPVTLINPEQQQTNVRDLHVALNTTNLAEGLNFAIRGKADPPTNSPTNSPQAPPQARHRTDEPEGTIGRPPAADQPPPQTAPASAAQGPGDIDVTGKLVGFLNEAGAFDVDAAKLEMTANVTSMPTAIADAFADMQGLLVAAVGPQMNAKFIANDFSVNSGTLDARIDATNGWLEAPLRGREHAFRTKKDQAIRAELEITPQLRERLLQNIHPILADIRTTEQPLRINIPLAVAPLQEGSHSVDISQLKGDIEITIGKVELHSGSRTLSLLRFFGEAEQRATIPGRIEPIIATIRNGVVKYQKFTVQIDKYTLDYSGEIDLVAKRVNLRTEVPLKALGQAVRELEPYADKIVVPLVTRGKFDNLKTQIDPDFDLGKAALDAGFRGGLQQLLEGEGAGSLKDLLEGLDRKKK